MKSSNTSITDMVLEYIKKVTYWQLDNLFHFIYLCILFIIYRLKPFSFCFTWDHLVLLNEQTMIHLYYYAIVLSLLEFLTRHHVQGLTPIMSKTLYLEKVNMYSIFGELEFHLQNNRINLLLVY